MNNNNIYSTKNKVINGMLSSLASLILATGCSNPSQNDITSREIQTGKIQLEKDRAVQEQVAKGLGFRELTPLTANGIVKFPGGYYTGLSDYNNVLSNIAGIYAGTVDVEKGTTASGERWYKPNGLYEYSENPDALFRVQSIRRVW